MRISIISFTPNGCQLNKELGERLAERKGVTVHCYTSGRYASDYGLMEYTGTVKEYTGHLFQTEDAVLFISACGIAVRSIASYVKDKFTDPAVLVMDELGEFVISLLSGHVGGANELAELFSELTGAVPVVTTATDRNHCFAVDVFAKRNGLLLTDRRLAKEISSAVLRKEAIGFLSECMVEGTYPKEIIPEKIEKFSIWVSPKRQPNGSEKMLHLIPKNVYLGIGCRKQVRPEVLEEAILFFLEESGFCLESVIQIASIDLKKEEEALIRFSEKYKIPFVTYSAAELNTVEGEFSASSFVSKVTGTDNVCERSCLLSSGNGKLKVKKRSRNGVTFALAVAEKKIRFS